MSPDDRPLVSVVVPVAHGGTLLAKALTSLARLDTAPEEVEVLVAGSIAEPEARDTVERLARDGRCRQVDDSDDALSVRLNRAAAAARGRVLVFLDDDCTAPPDWLSVLGEILAERPDAGIVGGRDELAGTDRAFDVALDHVLTSPLALGLFRRRGDPPPKLWNMAVPREAAEAVRARDGFLFRESLDVHQDVDLSERIRRTGRAVVHAPGWIVHHRRETTLRSCLARNRRMARAGRRHGLQRRAHAGLACGLVFGLVLVALAVLSPASRPFVLGLAGLAVVGPFVDAWFRTRRLTAALWAPVLLHGIAVARAVGHVRG